MTTTDNRIPKLDGRLALAASFVSGDTAADIGTDHAYIPVYLLKSGRCRRAIASDINAGPIDNARKSAAEYGVSENIDFYLSDGLDGVPLEGVTDILICGMGGELTARIISACPRLYTAGDGTPRLILQPMSGADKLRRFLAKDGFEITDGGVAEAAGKLYQCIVCRYTGKPYSLTPAEELAGAKNEPLRRSPLYGRFVRGLIEKTKKAAEGKKRGGLDTAYDEALLKELCEIYKSCTAENGKEVSVKVPTV
ncbi:MAG: tRNA (adenine(22)-N(1))-methyltransferase [Candidatus Avispirillum sp.]